MLGLCLDFFRFDFTICYILWLLTWRKFQVLSKVECPPFWTGRLAKVTYSTVDEFKRSGGEAINERELKITSLAALATDVFCSELEGKLAFHRVSLTKHCMRKRDCRVPLTYCIIAKFVDVFLSSKPTRTYCQPKRMVITIIVCFSRPIPTLHIHTRPRLLAFRLRMAYSSARR